MKTKQWIFLSSIVLISFALVSCNGTRVTSLPTSPSNSNETVPTASTQMALATDTSLPPAETEAATQAGGEEAAKPSNPGGNGEAVTLTGNPSDGKTIFDQTCSACHGPNGTQGISNPGSEDGSVPALNPIDPTIANADPMVFAKNADLFLEHGSTPAGPNPQVKMPNFGDSKTLSTQQIADVLAYLIQLNSASASGTSQPPAGTAVAFATNAPVGSPVPGNTESPEAPAQETSEATAEPARPSTGGAPGVAITLKGDAANGQALFSTTCTPCHGPQGTKGTANPGSDDGSVPTLNPIDPTIANADAKVFATNVDLFLEHGSTPEGSNPALKMPAFGDTQTLTPQQIADITAYVISLNQQK
jgi:mono/diheme cytochrome c family protein